MLSACCFSRLAKEPLEFIPKQFVDRAKDGPTAVVYFLHVFVGNERVIPPKRNKGTVFLPDFLVAVSSCPSLSSQTQTGC